jgi:hypothetical protein
MQTFAPTKLGRYVVGLTADDGCSSSSTTITIDYRCDLAPTIQVKASMLVVSQRDAAHPFPITVLNGNLLDPQTDLVTVTWFLLPVSVAARVLAGVCDSLPSHTPLSMMGRDRLFRGPYLARR